MMYVIIKSNWFKAKRIKTNDAKETLIKNYFHYYRNVLDGHMDNNSALIITNDGQIIDMKIMEE